MYDFSNDLILKVLNGSQSGVEVSLANGEYTLGSGADDDLQFVNVNLKRGHARLKISEGKIEAAGGAGTIVTADNSTIGAGDDNWREISPLDVFTIGGTAFAIGAPDAQWSSLANYQYTQEIKYRQEKPARGKARESQGEASLWPRFAWGGLALVVLVAFIGWTTSFNSTGDANTKTAVKKTDYEIVRNVLDSFEFGKSVFLIQEADGTLFANGYVAEAAERRAIRNAVEKTGIQARLRLWVLSSLETQIDGVIEFQKIPVTYELDDTGAATFSGNVLETSKASKFLDIIEEEVTGLSEITSNIRTADTYFTEVKKLAERSEIADNVLFRLDRELIEVSGIVTPEKLDNFVGFIQSYARRFADYIPLRSYVQLVNDKGEVVAEPNSKKPGEAVVLGGEVSISDAASTLNLSRLKQGSFGTEDVFMGFDTDSLNDGQESVTNAETGAETEAGADASAEINELNAVENAQPLNLGVSQPAISLVGGERSFLSAAAKSLIEGGASESKLTELLDNGLVNETVGNANDTEESDKNVAIKELFKQVSNRWDNTLALSGASNVSGVAGYTNVLTSDNNSDVSSLQMRVENYITKKTIENQFLPLVLSPKANGEICWNNSRLNHTNLPAVLFWLDMLSISNKVSLNAFEIEDQHLLLEAALSPDKTRECARQISKNVSASIEKISVYLGEIERNNEFISFIARATPRFTLDIGGVMLNGEERYIQTMDGRRFNEGSAPDLGSRIASVGELGILILLDDKLETVIYGQNLNWKSNGDLSRL